MNKNKNLNPQLKAKLTDAGFQRGLEWRQEKVNAVAEARQIGVSEEEIFRQLKIAGLTDITAKRIMRDAFYLEDFEGSKISVEEIKTSRKKPKTEFDDDEIKKILTQSE